MEKSKNQSLETIIRNKIFFEFIITLQEAFSAVIPYFLLLSFLILFNFLTNYFQIYPTWVSKETLKNMTHILDQGASIVVTISISYFFATRFKLCQAVAIILSIATLLTILYIQNPTLPLKFPSGFTPVALINPIVTTLLLYTLYPFFTLKIPEENEHRHVYRLFNYVFVFIFAYIATIIIYLIASYIWSSVISFILQIPLNLPDFITYILRDLLIQIGWFFGIHGNHTVNALLGKDILSLYIFPNLTYAEFNRLFVVIGGSGVGIALLIAMLLYIKDRSYKLITHISLPFVIFNINTLLIYAIVVLNRFLFIPFILLPIANILIAYTFLSLVNITFTSTYIVWTTPIFLDGFIKTDGNILLWLLQATLILFDTLVYIYFIKKYLKAKEFTKKENQLKKNLNINLELHAKRYINAYVAHKEIIEADAKLEKILTDLKSENIHLYYQPKIAFHSYECKEFEALLRYEKDGQIVGPIFLDAVEKAGLSYIIDLWVARQVSYDIQRFKKENFFPKISINLHPDTIQNEDAINKILHYLEGEDVIFEIVERSLLNKEIANKNLHKIQQNGFMIAIDDFGIGYSSLETLIQYKIDELKLDKSLIDIVHTPKGKAICKNIITLCHEIDAKVVAEGVENEQQLNILKELDADYIQGFYYSKAIPFQKVIPFVSDFRMKWYIG
jgi:EAL domain-containing protein (putative c-di-GMP-specific phosphodiesterase class I)/cellobiose-specific phosphotransferase system component IIC